MLEQYFKGEKEEMKAEVSDDAKMQEENRQKMMTEGKIECPRCTVLNELTSDRCEVCDALLYD